MAVTDKSDYEDDLLEDIQEYEYQEMFEKANNVVLGFVASTTATGAVPIPFADAPLLIGQQVAMMIAINSVFEFDIERDALTSLATAAIGVGGAMVRTAAASACWSGDSLEIFSASPFRRLGCWQSEQQCLFSFSEAPPVLAPD